MPLGFGRRTDGEPPSPFGANASAPGASSHGTGRYSGRPRGAEVARATSNGAGPRPGRGARVVARPRISAVLLWLFMVAIGLACLADGGTGLVIFGFVWTAVLGSLFVLVLRNRVVVDGDRLYARAVRGWRPSVDLARLRSATVVSERNLSTWVVVVDRDGVVLRIDAVNLRLRGLYRELATRVGPWDDVADACLERKIARFR